VSTRSILLLGFVLTIGGCVSHTAKTASADVEPKSPSCSMDAASPWVEKWFSAWETASRKILELPDAPAPTMVFFDSTCVYTTSPIAAHGAPAVKGPKFLGQEIPWRAVVHDTSVTMPDSSQRPIGLMSFASSTPGTGPYFVMAAPEIWARVGARDDNPGLAVFLHEFTHTRQMGAFRDQLGPIDSAWKGPDVLDDDVVQRRFSADSVYVKAYIAERDLLYKAADAATVDESRALASEALAMMRARHAKYFTGENADYATLDNIWLAMEGAAQWTAAAWLSHPDGGHMSRDAAVKKMLGKRRWWAQDESLALFLVVDRLMPDWPRYEFSSPALGAIDLLEKALIK
jgi:hypothetical protein